MPRRTIVEVGIMLGEPCRRRLAAAEIAQSANQCQYVLDISWVLLRQILEPSQLGIAHG